MQCRSFEKCVWGFTFILCAALLSAHDASAASGEGLSGIIQNPMAYIIGLAATFIGVKLFAGSPEGF